MILGDQIMAEIIRTNNCKFCLRFAKRDDVKIILNFIKELAEYEKLSDEVTATEEGLIDSLFVKKYAEVIIGEYENEPVGFALFFHNYSTFLGKPGLYLEDIYVKPNMRGMGLGKIFLSYLAKLAIQRGCGRFEWWCLDWNETAINFYKNLGAVPMDDWTIYRVTGEALQNLSKIQDIKISPQIPDSEK